MKLTYKKRIRRACQILQQLTQTTDWRQRCPRPQSARRSYREDIDTFLQTHEASVTHMPSSRWICFHVCGYECQTLTPTRAMWDFVLSVYLQDCEEKWSMKWSTSPLPPVPFLQPCKASKAKQRHHCVGASLSKMRQEGPRRCLLLIFFHPFFFNKLHTWETFSEL